MENIGACALGSRALGFRASSWRVEGFVVWDGESGLGFVMGSPTLPPQAPP